jgi:hypothetical protein
MMTGFAARTIFFSARIGFALVFACSALLSSTQVVLAQSKAPRLSQAPRERVLVMVIRGPNITPSEEAIRRRVGEVIERRLHVEVVSTEETFVQVGASFQKMLEDCRGEAPCYARLVGSVDARYLLVISARKVRDSVVFGSRMIDLDTQKVAGKAIGRISSEDPLLDSIEPQLQKTVPVEMWNPYGSLFVKVVQSGAEVFVNQKLMGLSPLQEIENLLPGTFAIEVSLRGYETSKRDLIVERMKRTSSEISLEKSAGLLSQWWFWTAVGVLAASGVTAGVLASRESSPVFCSSPDPNACP